MKILLLIVLSSLVCSSAYARAPVKTIFSCTTTNGKQLTVQRQGADYVYSFGRKGRPELVFRNSKRNVVARSITSSMPAAIGIGGFWSEMNMINRGYEYSVFWRVNNDDEHTITQGVEVTKLNRRNDLRYNSPVILCDDRYPIIDNPDPEFML
ncbi:MULTISPECIES: hypothetical protein [Eikenella]|nr:MULTISPECIES: hypothetical protein [Eikenella]